MRQQLASERRGQPRPRGGGRVRRRQVPRQRDAGNGGRGRSERSERSPLRGKLLPLRSSAHKKKSSREPICPGAMSGGVRVARWTQIGAIARADVPCRPLEWRLPCQVNCKNVWDRALTAVRGRSESFLQTIARADVPWSDAWRGSRRPMDTNRCHRASRYGLEAPRMAIAVPDEWQESEEPGTGGCVWQVGVLPANHRASEYALECCLEGFAALDGHKSVPSREPICPGGP